MVEQSAAQTADSMAGHLVERKAGLSAVMSVVSKVVLKAANLVEHSVDLTADKMVVM